MVEFYPDGESNHRSEKLAIKWSESLIVQVGKSFCGSCRVTIHGAEELSSCPASDCGIDWQQVIYTETIVAFRHKYLPMVGKAVLPMFERPKRPDASPLYPFIGRRAVENVTLVDDVL